MRSSHRFDRGAIGRDRKGLGLLMEARNIIQGSVGDCYFMSAIAGLLFIKDCIGMSTVL